jgi:hypothetical protein
MSIRMRHVAKWAVEIIMEIQNSSKEVDAGVR